MNKKKCPKCGEENPAEAVMCWACYTPLSGSSAAAPAGAAPGARNAPPATSEYGEKKGIPPWQLGIIAAGLLLAVGAGVRSMMPGSTDEEDDDIPITQPADTGGGGDAAAPAPAPASAVVTPAAGGGGTVVVSPTEAPFTIVVPPNPKTSVATMAIVPTDTSTSGPMAASYAAYARRQFTAQAKNWNTLYIYVFADAETGKKFAEVMRRRRGAALTPSDYSALSSLWSSTLARYEYSVASGKRIERVQYPSKNPSGWWYDRQ